MELAISTSAACFSCMATPSHVLQALGLPDVINGSLHISLGKLQALKK